MSEVLGNGTFLRTTNADIRSQLRDDTMCTGAELRTAVNYREEWSVKNFRASLTWYGKVYITYVYTIY